MREGTVFRRGMLEQIRVGHTTTPDEAWTRALGHRELGAVRSLARAHAPPVHYARLAASLPHLRSIDVDRLAFIDALEAYPPLPNVTHVRYCSNAGYPHSVTPDELHTLFERATARFPNVELVQLTRVHNMQRLGDLGQVVRALPSLFSRLRAIQIETARMPSIPRDLEQLPLVELIR